MLRRIAIVVPMRLYRVANHPDIGQSSMKQVLPVIFALIPLAVMIGAWLTSP